MVSKYWEERRKKEEKEEKIIITNKNPDKIIVKSKFDNNFNIWRVEVKLKGGKLHGSN